jgi:2-aminoethylphosphonate-pyruvate transaminase
MPHTVVETSWTSPPDLPRLAHEAAAPDVEAIAVVHHETTTGLINPVAEVGGWRAHTESSSSSTR